MSTRRAPLSTNANAANSPMRTRPSGSLASVLDKHRLQQLQQQKRSYASAQREDPYGQPPPHKKQLLNDGSKEAIREPPPVRQVKVQRKDPNLARNDPRNEARIAHAIGDKFEKLVAQQAEEAARMRHWKESTKAKFPDNIFYFESVPDDKRSKLVKQITQLGGVSPAPPPSARTTHHRH